MRRRLSCHQPGDEGLNIGRVRASHVLQSRLSLFHAIFDHLAYPPPPVVAADNIHYISNTQMVGACDMVLVMLVNVDCVMSPEPGRANGADGH
jgi:hypothetical protein